MKLPKSETSKSLKPSMPSRTERTAAKAARQATKVASSPNVEWLAPSGFRFDPLRMPMVCSPVGVPSFVDLATLLTTGHVARGRRGLAICGAATGTGVSFVSANLAAAVAMSGVPTRLVEANLRSPSLADAIRPPQILPSLSDYLLDEEVGLLDVVHPDVISDLSITFAGARHAEASDLLTSARFASFAQACLRDSTLTIFDTAPANRAVDARVAAKEAGYALIVARRGRSFHDDVAMLSTQLAQDGVVIIGTVMNGG
jgi:Mrp family chromosome partitioning ATPase